MTKATALKGKRLHYKTNHPLYGSDNVFDSWMTLCEVTLELAEQEMGRRMNDAICSLADEMIETVEEYEPQENN